MRNCAAAYKESRYTGRRKLNAGLIDAFFLKDQDIVEVQLTDLYTTLSRPTLVPNIQNEIEILQKEEDDVTDAAFNSLIDQMRNPEPASLDEGSRIPELVGLKGFEPSTFRPPAGRATKLRHSPL